MDKQDKSDVVLVGEFDAEVWVNEWLRTIEESPFIPTDRGTMIGWFANAIMAGYDHAHQEVTEVPNDDPPRQS